MIWYGMAPVIEVYSVNPFNHVLGTNYLDLVWDHSCSNKRDLNRAYSLLFVTIRCYL